MNNPCQVDGCTRPHKARGLCELHYRRERRRGTTALIPHEKTKCQVPACTENARSNNYCPVHFRAWVRHGDPLVRIYGLKHTRTCLIDTCSKGEFQRGLCKTHYPNYRYHLSRNHCKNVDGYIDFKNQHTQKASGQK